MTSQIPEDFGSEWDLSDVVLHTLDSDGKELYANKSVLAVFSPYFRAMFFSFFKEAHEKQVGLQCDYLAMKKILRIIHHESRDFSAVGGQQEYSAGMLRSLYETADMLDFPVVRKLCRAQMLARPSVEMANAVHSLMFHDLLMDILAKMDTEHLKDFLSEENRPNLAQHLIFSKKDVNFFCHKTGVAKRLAIRKAKPLKCPLILEEISQELAEPRIDLTQKWNVSDVALLAKNSLGRPLYSNKAILASVSPYFYRLFFESRVAPEYRLFDENLKEEEAVVPVDVEYTTLKEILSIIHNCDMNFSKSGYTMFHPVLLYDMYLAASVDNLDIPMIRKFCCDNLLEQSGLITWAVVVKLGIDDMKSALVSFLYAGKLWEWVLFDDKVSYLRGGREIIISAGREEPVLSSDDLRAVFKRLSGEPTPALGDLWGAHHGFPEESQDIRLQRIGVRAPQAGVRAAQRPRQAEPGPFTNRQQDRLYLTLD